MRWFAFLFALLLAAPAAAQDHPAWAGVWDGRIGTYPIRLCIDQWDDVPARGAYYYLSQLEPISLDAYDGEGGWTEHSAESEARWEFAEQSGTRLKGTWRQGERSLPFDLTPMAWTEGEWGGPCGSEAFLGPRLDVSATLAEPAELGGWPYTRLTYRPPAWFKDDVAIQSFAFMPEEPGDSLIFAWLGSKMPRGAITDEYIQCMGGSISSVGFDGMFDEVLIPTLVTRAFLTVEQASGNFCGGAHPNYYTYDHTFDRRTGEELDLFDWLGEARIDGEDSLIDPRLRALVVARWPKDAEAECRDLAETTDYWSLGLALDGLIFRPDFPHVATVCEEPVVVEWKALAPFLDAEGKAGLARLQQ